jgi:LPXTG-motif cell wall-anchored protein
MTCEPLPNTGLDAPVLVVLGAAVLFLLVGVWILLRARRFRGGAAATLVLVVIAVGAGITVGLAPASPAYATPLDCTTASPGQITESATEPGADNSLTITQTSTMDNLAPGVEPVEITGRVVNNGPDDTFITAISVEIVGVTKLTGSAAGPCDASDYVLVDSRMPVGKLLAPNGGSTAFRGAAIGFNNKSTNQDACQGATIQLRYRTVQA